MGSILETDADLWFESFGVSVAIESDDPALLRRAEQYLQNEFAGRISVTAEKPEADLRFAIRTGIRSRLSLYFGGAELGSSEREEVFLKLLSSAVRIRVAEQAKDVVFIHSGAVGWRGRAILIPGKSLSGKSTLVNEMVKCGAEYYSDEYAILDENGRNHAFPRPIMLRQTGKWGENEAVAAVDGVFEGLNEPVPVGLILLTEFNEGSTWAPEELSPGNGILEVVPHTIPLNRSPVFSMKVLKTALSRAIILKGMRGDAKASAQAVLSFFDNRLD